VSESGPEREPVGGTRAFLPALQGMRACAAIAVVVTHVALQTGHTDGIGGRLLGRLDLAVAVFFALSGFLLWRAHAAAAHGLGERPATGPYLRSRVIRIVPAYLAVVIVVLVLLPDARDSGLTAWLANLTLTQVYLPLALAPGLTQMWSLSVEMSFYLALPLLALAARWLPARARVPAIAVVALASFGWGYLPIPAVNGANPLNWLPAYASWFGIGMVLAEWACRPLGWMHRLARRRVLMAVIALAAYLVAASPLVIPRDLAPATVAQFVTRTAMGAVIAGALLAPLVLGRPTARHRVLGSAAMLTLGRWSYGLFLWHLAAIDIVFAVLGRYAFAGDLPVVLVLTLLCGFAIAAASYALVEEPCRVALRRWESGRKRAVPPQDGPDATTARPTQTQAA
jgi:peptidoglycan/LPS O-acetylase OafA/YrhL